MKKEFDFAFKSFIVICLCIIFILFQMINSSKEQTYFALYLIAYLIITYGFIIKEKENIVNIKSIFVAMYSIMIGLSPLFYYLNRKTLISITGESITYQYVFILIGYIAMILGFYIFNPKVKKTDITDEEKTKYNKIFACVLIVISAIFNLYYIYANRRMFLGGNLEDGRIQALASNGVIIILTSLYLLGIGFLYDNVLRTNKGKLQLAIIIAINIIFFLIRGSRTSIVYIFILMLIIKNNYKPLKPATMIKFCIAILLILAGLQMFRSNLSGDSSSFIKNIYNSLQVGSVNLDYVYNTFPEKKDFQYGYTYLINILMMLPGNDPDFTLWLKESIGINFSGGGVTPTLIGEGYINFGIIGIIISMIFTGVIGTLLDKKYNMDRKNIVWISYIIVKIINIFRNGYAGVEISLLVVTFLFVVYTTIGNYMRKQKVYIYGGGNSEKEQ